MNKELTSLEWLNYYKSIIKQSHKTFRPNGFEIIETALKDYNEIINNKYHIANPLAYISYAEETLDMFNLDSGEELRNTLRALKIIKEKCLKIDFKTLLASTDYETYCFMLNSTKYLTKEEYGLLKEVLL